jgi:hypothetical protein
MVCDVAEWRVADLAVFDPHLDHVTGRPTVSLTLPSGMPKP